MLKTNNGCMCFAETSTLSQQMLLEYIEMLVCLVPTLYIEVDAVT